MSNINRGGWGTTRTKRPWRERFLEKVDRSGGPDACWPWTASKVERGYGQFCRAKSRPERAHRIAWEISNGPIPAGLVVRHLCAVPACCNPAHLAVGTDWDNAQDAKIHRALGITPRSWAISLTDDEVMQIRAFARSGRSARWLARAFPAVTRCAMYQVVRGETWSHLPGALPSFGRSFRLTESQRRQIVKLYVGGKTYARISEATGRSSSTVTNVVREAGLIGRKSKQVAA